MKKHNEHIDRPVFTANKNDTPRFGTAVISRNEKTGAAIYSSLRKIFISSSTVPIPAMPKVSTSSFATLGDRKPGSVETLMLH